ncbi:integrase [Novosphingobium chloroacetimidivorans]|uniref:Integrase n=1 Tax=Novosphingobium chloroacetimidivorans TaxID=1428314 RepID=A0A7W7NXP5_9SPHN|nr:tyrosine-type recombinase/integrase [Novosphingobium chloroacetimidivorans]MBB4859684.1 integrase [Novosphingobium chloroacetimidivorans]
MTGLHVVSKRLATGRRWFVYAWRGGPCIHKQDGEEKPVITREILDAQYRAQQDTIGRAPEDVDWLIKAYEASPKYINTKPSTKKDYRLWLTRISKRFGTTPVDAFCDWRMRGDVIEWRDEWAHMPRTADKAVVMMVTLLNWGVENGKLERHFCHGIGLLHSADRSEQIWEDRHWTAVEKEEDFPAHVMTALRLARLTGLRLGDLVALEWKQVFDKQITVERTRKRGGRAVIPIFPELRKLLAEIGRKDEGTVLLNSRKQPWTASGLETVWQRKQPKGFDRTLHDLRGTFVTFLAVKGLTDEQIARIVGWTAEKVGEIRARYVDEARVVVSLVERLSG